MSETMADISCFLCGRKDNLQMLPHRNANRNIAGWFFTCPLCLPKIAGNDVHINIVERPKQ